jgi:hypothetical protein
MLVLIVVAAATSLSIFVAQYQKQLQAEQKLTHDRQLETLQVISAHPTLNLTTGTTWLQLNFTLASLYVNPSIVTQIRINDNPLKQYSAFRFNLTTGQFTWTTVAAGGQLTLLPREQLNILVNFSGGASSFYIPSFVLHTTDFVKIEAITYYQNDFQRVFVPPTAIGVVTIIVASNGLGGYTTQAALDGTRSFEPSGGNSSLVNWTWTTFPDNKTFWGAEAVVVGGFNAAFTLHHITLTLTNSDGLIGVERFTYP